MGVWSGGGDTQRHLAVKKKNESTTSEKAVHFLTFDIVGHG